MIRVGPAGSSGLGNLKGVSKVETLSLDISYVTTYETSWLAGTVNKLEGKREAVATLSPLSQ